MDEVMKSEEKKERALFDTKKEPRKSFSTFLRNQNKLYVNSVNVIDRKAAIMIRVNATIVSAVVLFYQYVESMPNGKWIALILVICSFSSLMFAINASRPHTFSLFGVFKSSIRTKYPNLEENLFIVGANGDASLEAYEDAYNKLLKSQSLQIGSQVRSMYAMEKRVEHSFKHIELAYLIFMVGFSLVVALFVISNVL